MVLNSIKSALYLSFSFFILLTLVSVVTSWLSFNDLKDNQLDFVNSHIPSLIKSHEMAVLSGDLTVETNKLLTVKTQPALTQQWNNLSISYQSLFEVIEAYQKNSLDNTNTNIDDLLEQLDVNLKSIHDNVLQSLKIQQIIFEIKIRLDWLKADTVDELTPLINDLSFNLDQAINSARFKTNNSIAEEITQLTLLSSLLNQLNLIHGVVTQTIDTDDIDSLMTSQLYTTQLINKLQKDTIRLEESATTVALIQSINDYFSLILGDGNVYSKGQIKLELFKRSLELANNNQQVLSILNNTIKTNVKNEEQTVLNKSLHIFKQLKQSQFVLLIIFVVSVLLAIAIGWLYVKNSLVRRILQLNDNMQRIALGDMATHIKTQGNDEITNMALSLKTFSDTLVETQKELLQAGKLAALGQLSAGVAHELNQPLAAIRNYTYNSQVLIEREEYNQAIKALDQIDSLTDHMAEIISQFKQFSRKSSAEIKPILLSEAINNVLTILENTLETKGVVLTLPSDIADIKVNAEMIRLEQVLVNLLLNALDAIDNANTKNIEISCDIDRADDRVLLTIKDSGCGILDKDLKQIFEPFYSTKKSKGLGLGLSISYNIMKDFNGTLECASSSPLGTTFNMHLQLAN